MPGTRRSNKSKGQTKGKRNASWFEKNKARWRKRDKLAKLARRKNRGK